MATPTGAGPLCTGALDRSALCRWVERTCAEQGIGVAVSDTRTIARLVALLGATNTAPQVASRP